MLVGLPDIDADSDGQQQCHHGDPSEDDSGEGHAFSFDAVGIPANFAKSEIPENQADYRTNPVDPEDAEHQTGDRQPAGGLCAVEGRQRIRRRLCGTWQTGARLPVFAIAAEQGGILNLLATRCAEFHATNLTGAVGTLGSLFDSGACRAGRAIGTEPDDTGLIGEKVMPAGRTRCNRIGVQFVGLNRAILRWTRLIGEEIA